MEVVVFLKLHLLLYADDTVILAETPNDLQISLNSMAEYCRLGTVYKCYKNSSNDLLKR